MKKLCLAAAVLSAVCSMAGTAELSSKLLPGKVKVSYILEELISKAGEAEKYKTVVPEKAKIAWSENIIKRGNALDINITITNNSDKPRFLRVLASAAVPFAKFDWWNGYVNVNDQKFDPADKILSTWFPANAAISKDNALILGLDPMILCSRVISGITDKNTLVGIKFIEKGILDTLSKMGVEEIDTTGKFNPELHQAIDTEDSADHESGDIIKVASKGFTYKGKVIRYSQVIVKK